MENLDNAVELMEVSRGMRILFVEDSIALQRQIERFLSKLFKEVYVASNGEEGLELFKQHNPDLVLTDLTMPKMNGHDMIDRIKEVNPDVEIIILSAHSDSDNLIRSLHIGVSDFIQKPANISKMITVFLKVTSKIKRKESSSGNICEVPSEEKSTEILDFIHKNDISIDLINHYRGIPIINSAKIVSLAKNEMLLKTNYIQLMAIRHENSTTIDSSLMSKDIDCKLVSYNVDTYEVRLQILKIYFPSSKNREEVRVEPDETFKAYLVTADKKLEVTVKDLSVKGIIFKAKELSLSLKKDDIETLEIVYKEFVHPNSVDKAEEFVRIPLKTRVYKIEDNGDIVVILIDPNQMNSIRKYVVNREMELFEEFKITQNNN
ncbi:MAG: response regulator [Arcobacteraceae bacterium]